MKNKIDLNKYALFGTINKKHDCVLYMQTPNTQIIVDREIKTVADIVPNIEQFTDVYKIKIVKSETCDKTDKNISEHHQRNQTQEYWIAGEVTNFRNLEMNKSAFSPEPTDKTMFVPIILKGKNNPFVRIKKNQIPTGRIQWHELTSNDIVLDKNLRQIYPQATKQIPQAIKELFQKTK